MLSLTGRCRISLVRSWTDCSSSMFCCSWSCDNCHILLYSSRKNTPLYTGSWQVRTWCKKGCRWSRPSRCSVTSQDRTSTTRKKSWWRAYKRSARCLTSSWMCEQSLQLNHMQNYIQNKVEIRRLQCKSITVYRFQPKFISITLRLTTNWNNKEPLLVYSKRSSVVTRCWLAQIRMLCCIRYNRYIQVFATGCTCWPVGYTVCLWDPPTLPRCLPGYCSLVQ